MKSLAPHSTKVGDYVRVCFDGFSHDAKGRAKVGLITHRVTAVWPEGICFAHCPRLWAVTSWVCVPREPDDESLSFTLFPNRKP